MNTPTEDIEQVAVTIGTDTFGEIHQPICQQCFWDMALEETLHRQQEIADLRRRGWNVERSTPTGWPL